MMNECDGMRLAPIENCRECPFWAEDEISGGVCGQINEHTEDMGFPKDCPLSKTKSIANEFYFRMRVKEALSALEQLVHLHGCEQEGLESGMPTPEQWEQAVDAAHRALKEARKEVAQ
jgi:hypothetical protein